MLVQNITLHECLTAPTYLLQLISDHTPTATPTLMSSSDCTTSLYLLNNGSPSRRKFLCGTHNSCVNSKCVLSAVKVWQPPVCLRHSFFAPKISKYTPQTGDLCRLDWRLRRYRIVRKHCGRQISWFHSKSYTYRAVTISRSHSSHPCTIPKRTFRKVKILQIWLNWLICNFIPRKVFPLYGTHCRTKTSVGWLVSDQVR